MTFQNPGKDMVECEEWSRRFGPFSSGRAQEFEPAVKILEIMCAPCLKLVRHVLGRDVNTSSLEIACVAKKNRIPSMGNAVLTGVSFAIWSVDNVNTSGLRTRPNIGWNGSDCLCFLGFPVLPRPGM
jgi:hypothetical protein